MFTFAELLTVLLCFVGYAAFCLWRGVSLRLSAKVRSNRSRDHKLRQSSLWLIGAAVAGIAALGFVLTWMVYVNSTVNVIGLTLFVFPFVATLAHAVGCVGYAIMSSTRKGRRFLRMPASS